MGTIDYRTQQMGQGMSEEIRLADAGDGVGVDGVWGKLKSFVCLDRSSERGVNNRETKFDKGTVTDLKSKKISHR